MSGFDFHSVPRIVFGRGRIAELGGIARPLGLRALLIHNGDEPGRCGPVDRAIGSLTAASVCCTPHRQKGEPTIADVDAGLAAARANACDLIIAVGGGSAIDAAKAIAGLLTNAGAALDYMEVIGRGQKIAKPAAPWVAVPTTAGTGAEATRNAVIGAPERKFKASLRSELLMAKAALLDPELGVGVPREVTAASGMDALCQVIESYVSSGANPMTDAVAAEGIRLAARSIRTAVADGSNLHAREAMAMAALLSGIALTNAGLGAVHGFAAPLGANFPVPHGVVCARLLPGVIKANIAALKQQSPKHPSLIKYETVGFEIESIEFARVHSAPDPLEMLVAWTAGLVTEFNIPSLGHYGLTESRVGEMVELAKKSSSMRYNPVVLADEVLADILRTAL
jgi:alcohol dehydrogenase class IV